MRLRNSFSVLRRQSQSVVSAKQQERTNIQVSSTRAARIKVNDRHQSIWLSRNSLTQRSLAGLPYIGGTCPRNLRLPKKYVRAFNLFFDGFMKQQAVTTPTKVIYVSALVTWANLARREKRDFANKAMDLAMEDGIFFWSEIASVLRHIDHWLKVRSYKIAEEFQRKLDGMLGAVRLILVGTPQALHQALTVVPNECRFGFSKKMDRVTKEQMKKMLKSLGRRFISWEVYLKYHGLVSSSDEDSDTSDSSYE